MEAERSQSEALPMVQVAACRLMHEKMCGVGTRGMYAPAGLCLAMCLALCGLGETSGRADLEV